MCGIELRLVPVATYITDDNMTTRLKQVTIKQIHVSTNVKTCEIDRFNNIENPMTTGSELTLNKLIVDRRTEDA